MKKKNLFLSIFTLVLLSCSSSSTQDSVVQPEGMQQPQEIPPENTNPEWSIPISEVLDGGPGKDGIPALLSPEMVPVQEVDFLRDDDLVIGFKNGSDVRAYPHIILDWHEIINDKIGDVSLAVTYCPLTGTGIGWDRFINGQETTFGVSGLLYNTNLIPYDRLTNSNWSQILNESVNGALKGEQVNLIAVIETDWKTWKAMYPSTKVVSLSTGFSRTYGASPYGDYNTNNSFFLFPVAKDQRLPLKERVHAVINNDKAKTYRFSDFESINMIRDSFDEKTYLIVGNQNFMTSFELGADLINTQFEYIFNGTSSVLLKDAAGNQWNVFGASVAGDGPSLKAASSFMGYWFSIPAFYETKVFGEL